MEIESFKGKTDIVFSLLYRGWSCLGTRETNKKADSGVREDDVSFDIKYFRGDALSLVE